MKVEFKVMYETFDGIAALHAYDINGRLIIGSYIGDSTICNPTLVNNVIQNTIRFLIGEAKNKQP